MKGIILSGGSGTRLFPLTKSVSKQLLPIYSKPLVYYPLSTFMLAEIRDIFVITTPEDNEAFKRLLGDGKDFGVNISYGVQLRPEGLAQAFLIAEKYGFLKEGEPCALILGDNIFYSAGLSTSLKRAVKRASYANKATIYGISVKDAWRYGVAEISKNGNVIGIEEKPEHPKSNICVTGLYFYPDDILSKAKQVTPSARGELEITTINQMYVEEKRMLLEQLNRGSVWLDAGTVDSLYEATAFVETIEKRTGTMICCPEEIALNNFWITEDEFTEAAKKQGKSEYGKYLYSLIERK